MTFFSLDDGINYIQEFDERDDAIRCPLLKDCDEATEIGFQDDENIEWTHPHPYNQNT